MNTGLRGTAVWLIAPEGGLEPMPTFVGLGLSRHAPVSGAGDEHRQTPLEEDGAHADHQYQPAASEGGPAG